MYNLFSISLALFCVLFLSCNSKNIQETNSTTKIDTITTSNETVKENIKETVKINSNLDDAILEQIKKHYLEDGKNMRLVKIETDQTIEMKYYNIPTEKDGYSFSQMTITIPKISSSESVFLGDLNNDNNEDLIVSVSTQGGWGGGNIGWDDIFIFLKEGNNYKLKLTKTSSEMVSCNGSMAINEIKDNKIIGESFCYAKDDARCCPSLNYDVSLKLEGDKIILDKQTKK